ncbi:DUF4153 domain-containing protein [Nonomuraea roseola]|uniref:Signal transduction histidine-protein kinase/phosphatase MprB n=1 Tax=Nonomuraea roseola TaxID=46179 RepID=A0ABV5PRI9_9ACTN
MRPLDFLGRIKVKLGIVIVLAVGTAFVVNEVGLNAGASREVRIAVASILALIMVQVLAHGMTKPLRQLASAAQTIAKGHYTLRVRASSRDEVGELARAFNAMAADLGEVDRQRRELVANVSHELRTPITGLRAVLENVVDGVSAADPVTLGTALAQTERLGRLVAQLLDLSRLDSGVRHLEAEPVTLEPLLQQAAREAALARDDVTITYTCAKGLVAGADPDLLAQVLANLLDNAVRHSPSAGVVTLSASSHGQGVRLVVADRGPGIPQAARARVFERFSRLDSARAADAGGSGLGLAIVKEIVELHGGSIRIDDGAGCRMIVDLPERITMEPDMARLGVTGPPRAAEITEAAEVAEVAGVAEVAAVGEAAEEAVAEPGEREVREAAAPPEQRAREDVHAPQRLPGHLAPPQPAGVARGAVMLWTLVGLAVGFLIGLFLAFFIGLLFGTAAGIIIMLMSSAGGAAIGSAIGAGRPQGAPYQPPPYPQAPYPPASHQPASYQHVSHQPPSPQRAPHPPASHQPASHQRAPYPPTPVLVAGAAEAASRTREMGGPAGPHHQPPQGPRPPAPPYVPPPLFPRPDVPDSPRWLLPAVLGVGVFAAVALPDAMPGLGLALVALVLGAATLPAALRRVTPWTAAYALTAYGLVAMVAVRDADWLVVPLLGGAFGLGALAVSGAGRGWLALIRGGISIVLALLPVPWFLAGPMKTFVGRRRVMPLLAGLGITAVLLVVFGILFASADKVFASFVDRLFTAPDWAEALPLRIFVFVLFAALAAAAVLVAMRPVSDPVSPSFRTRLNRSLWVVPLTGLNLLFAAFVAVQVTALFGSSAWVMRTTGLTYADYARQGFFQLMVVSVFVLGIVAVATSVVKAERGDRWALAILLGVLCAFTLVILVSAMHRLDLYTDAYGLSRLRASVAATVWWLGAVFATVLVAGAVRLAGFGSAWLPRTVVLLTGAGLLSFAVWNPDLQVARTQVDIRGVERIDQDYVGDLGAEAVPELDRLPEPLRSCVLADVVKNNGLAEADSWNGWNLARAQARDLLALHPVVPQPACEGRSRQE